LTFFGTSYDHQRHNRKISELWGRNTFIWVRQGFVLPHFGTVYDSQWSYLIFSFFRRFILWYVPNTPCYSSVEGLLAGTPRPEWLDGNGPFEGRYESRYYPLIGAKPAPAVHVGSSIREAVSRKIKNGSGSDLPLRCALYLRRRGLEQAGDTSSVNRIMPDLAAHMPAIRLLNSAGYQVLLTGDVTASTDVIRELDGGLVDYLTANVEKDVFQLFAGTEVDMHIGTLSGGSSYVYATEIPALMLNGFAPGDGLPRTTVYYKWLFRDDGSMPALSELLGGAFYDHQLHGCRLVENSPEEIVEAVGDFVRNLSRPRPYGVDPIELGIDAPWLRAANARLSPPWLKKYNQSAESGARQYAGGR
jgi:hypothetical protein